MTTRRPFTADFRAWVEFESTYGVETNLEALMAIYKRVAR